MIIKEGNKSTTAYSKVLDLLDPGSFMETGEHISARLTSFYAPDEVQESDGVITGYGTIDDNLVFVYAQDEEVMGGTFGEMHGRKIFDLYDHAIKAEAPVIGILNTAPRTFVKRPAAASTAAPLINLPLLFSVFSAIISPVRTKACQEYPAWLFLFL